MVKLNKNQERILKAYAKECHPKTERTADFEQLCSLLYIHKEQDHITDKGLAYAVANMDYPFMKFLRAHHWDKRLRIFLDFAKRAFTKDEELNIYFKAKYRQNLAYDTFGENGQEVQLMPYELKQFTGKMFLELIDIPLIDWKKLRGLFKYAAEQIGDMDALALLNHIKDREQMKSYLAQFLDEQKALNG